MLRYLLFSILILPSLVHATPGLMTIGELRTMCKSSSPSMRGACDNYIVGVAEGSDATISIAVDVLKKEGYTTPLAHLFCFYSNTTREQLTAPVRKYVRDSVDKSDGFAIWVVTSGLMKSFPCPK
jgi:hypothetical protein